MFCRSLSARRAWIEILESKQIDPSVMVALRKESVDRNFSAMQIVIIVVESLSARRAWIEISDGNKTSFSTSSRSPQGERG